ncbi:MAG: hypothetical protein E7382_00375 [Clostridiales bacterium]|nr:hypothetical protein [Clostridiales bacterium]
MRKHFDFYGYNAPTCGKYYVDGEVYFLGEDFRSVKRYKEYKDIGFNIALLQHDNAYNGEPWEKSSAKKVMDICAKVGLKVILEDKVVKDLPKEEILVGENGRFKTEEEFEEFIDNATKVYRNHPAFYAIQLQDEPAFKNLKNYAIVYKKFKKMFPNMVLQCNLLNMVLHSHIAPDPENLQTRAEDLASYLRYFAKESDIDYLMTDEYAFQRKNVISRFSIPTFQVFANVCRETGKEMRMVLQSFCQEACVINPQKPDELDGGVAWRRINEKEMYWQMNLALGCGCKEFSYFTYFTKARKRFIGKRSGSDGVDGGALVNLDGTRTKLWFITKKIIKEFKEFEPVIIDYQYDNGYFFFPEGKEKTDFDSTKEAILSDVKNIPISVKTPKYPIYVTEMKNGSSRMYMVQNVGNPIEETLYNKRVTTIEVELGELADKAKFYYKGKRVERELNGTILKEKLGLGQAIFIEIE